jgi:hypothetical protein
MVHLWKSTFRGEWKIVKVVQSDHMQPESM